MKGLMDLICHLRAAPGGARLLTVVEIGSFAGESTQLWCAAFPRVHAIDPWEYDPSYPIAVPPGFDYASIERAFDTLLTRYPATLVKHKGRSLDVLREWSDPIDVLYIDGDHSYEAVGADIDGWARHVRHWICGHDYADPRAPGVQRAVEERCNAFLVFRDGSWAVHV
jgi:hypothetical protein